MLAADRPPTRVALVNNMPDPAFDATERQFLDLIHARPDLTAISAPVEVSLYSLPGIPRGTTTRTSRRERYSSLDELWLNPPDALIVTGTEPGAADLESEPYWDALAELIAWAEHTTVSTVLSCLAAHAALLIFDGVERRRLPEKRSGVFDNVITRGHPLVAGLDNHVPVPHSRLNDVEVSGLDDHGYTTLIQSDAGWSVAVKPRGRCLFVLCQGHLEYGADTLLREYRRDLRRFATGERAESPPVPQDYLDAERLRLIADEGFPFGEVSAGLAAPWRQPAERFYANWLGFVAEEAHRTRERVGSRG